ncbi:MAG TPA: hypothetical protein VF618_12450 [Thermoanaerobaculia bacterium]
MSVADVLGFPETVRTTVLLLSIALALAPLLAGVKFAGIEIPKLDPRRRRALRWIGPIGVVVAIALAVPLPALQRPSTQLRLLAADAMENGAIDVAVSNSGTANALLTGIELQVGRERTIDPRPVLETSATYHVPIGELAVGQRNRVAIRHLIAAGATERFSIHPETTRAATVQLSLFDADGVVLRTSVNLESNDR